MVRAGKGSTNCPLSPSFHPSIPPNRRAHLHLHTPTSTLICPWIELSWRIKEQSWDSFHRGHRLELSALRSQSCVCPCWPHLIQSKHSPRSAVPAPMPSHHTPISFIATQTSSNFAQYAPKCQEVNFFFFFSLIFFPSGVGTKAGRKDISVWSERGNICSKCF